MDQFYNLLMYYPLSKDIIYDETGLVATNEVKLSDYSG